MVDAENVNRELPKVAYLVMAFIPVHYYRRIFNVLYQDYPNELKTLILLHQKPYPSPLVHDLPFKVIEVNVEGGWPELWAFKMWAGVDVALKEGIDLVATFDEDDEYPPNWTKDTVPYILGEDGADGCWNWNNLDVKRSWIKYGKYDAPGGTLVVKTEMAKKAGDMLRAKFPLGKRRPDTPGTVDLTFCKMLMKICKIANHNVLRGYFRHNFANTNRRSSKDDIDYGFDYGGAVTVKTPKKAKGPNTPMGSAPQLTKKERRSRRPQVRRRI